MNAEFHAAAAAIARAEALVVTAGAGMGMDSGLPDFRGREGFWRANPPLAKLGLEFERIAQPERRFPNRRLITRSVMTTFPSSDPPHQLADTSGAFSVIPNPGCGRQSPRSSRTRRSPAASLIFDLSP